MRNRPHVIFSKGGYVSVPVALAGWILRIPIVSHESDLTPGLATRIIKRFASTILYTFPETKVHLEGTHNDMVGLPVREDLLSGDRSRGFQLCGFDESDRRPCVLIMGGSLGSLKINESVTGAQKEILKEYRIIHLTGKGKQGAQKMDGYCAFEFASDSLCDLFAIADLVVGRAGANSIFEFLTLKKPMLLIPLEAGSRGDQVQNAESFEKRGWARVLNERDLNPKALLDSINQTWKMRDQITSHQDKDSVKLKTNYKILSHINSHIT